MASGVLAFPMQNTSAQGLIVVGSGSGSNATNSYPAPFGNFYMGARHQFFVTFL